MAQRKKPSRYVSKRVKEAVRERDGNRCRICGIYKPEYPEYDHITPFSKGAPSTVENIQLLCRKCNLAKGSKSPECPKCGGWLPHNAAYCQNCGKTIQRPNDFKSSRKVKSNSFGIAQIIGVLMILFALYLLYKKYR